MVIDDKTRARLARLSSKAEEAAARRVRALAERDEAIRAAHAAGASLREIAAMTGLSHMGVQKVVRAGLEREEAPPPGGG